MSFPQPIFHLKGTQLKPFYSRGASHYATHKFTGTNDSVVTSLVSTGVFGSSVINRSGNVDGFKKILTYAGFDNAPSTGAWSVVIRIVPLWTGNPSTRQNLFQVGVADSYPSTLYAYIHTDGKMFISLTAPNNGLDICYGFTTSALSFTSGVPTEIMLTNSGVSLAPVKVYQDGSHVQDIAAIAAFTSIWNNKIIPSIRFGTDPQSGFQVGNLYINEFAIFDEVVAAYSPRTDFFTSIEANGDVIPLASDVRSGVIVGLSTGTAVIPTAADTRLGVAVDNTTGLAAIPTAENTRKGVAVEQTTGLLDVPQEAVVLVNYIYDNETKTGLLSLND